MIIAVAFQPSRRRPRQTPGLYRKVGAPPTTWWPGHIAEMFSQKTHRASWFVTRPKQNLCWSARRINWVTRPSVCCGIARNLYQVDLHRIFRKKRNIFKTFNVQIKKEIFATLRYETPRNKKKCLKSLKLFNQTCFYVKLMNQVRCHRTPLT